MLLVSTASLVAGAIENARLYDEMRLRVGELEHLTELAEAVAAAETIEALGPEVVRRSRNLLGAASVRLYLLDADEERLRLRWSDPPQTGRARHDRARRARAGARAEPPRAADHRLR